MFKPVYGLDTTLLADADVDATAFVLDAGSLCLLRNRVPDGDYTYLLIQQSFNYEIVKVLSIGHTAITVLRAQDDTVALNLVAGARVRFVLTAAALADIATQKGLDTYTLKGMGIVNVEQTGPFDFTISAPPTTITSQSPNILVEGDWPDYTLAAPEILDCCADATVQEAEGD